MDIDVFNKSLTLNNKIEEFKNKLHNLKNIKGFRTESTKFVFSRIDSVPLNIALDDELSTILIDECIQWYESHINELEKEFEKL